MRIVSVRLSDAEYASLVRRAGQARGTLSSYLRSQLKEPGGSACTADHSVADCLVPYRHIGGSTTTNAPAFVEWMTGHVGPNFNLRTL